ncbi:hypothetical protein [Paenibacillus sp. SI8]|uniref:hypothetical protein n=1 Tax=unclassified Paenibacillus TaxID=185978 RepID=UPI003467E7EE
MAQSHKLHTRKSQPSQSGTQHTSMPNEHKERAALGGSASQNFFLQMQRTVGNRATQAYATQLIQRNSGGASSPTAPKEDKLKDRIEGASIATDTFSESFGKPAEDLKTSFGKTKIASEGHKAASLGAVSSTADMIGGPLQMINSFREALSVSKDTDRTGHNKRWNYAGQGASIIEGAGKTVSGSAGLVDKAAKSSGSLDGVGKSSAVSDYTGTVGDAISAVKSAILAVKGIYDMYSKYSEEGALSKGDKAKGVIEIINNALQAASSSLKVAKGIMEIMETSTAALTTVIPGVSIAVSGVKIAFKSVDFIKAGLNRSAMTEIKRSFKKKNENASFIKAKRWFGGNTGVDKGKLEAHKLQLKAGIDQKDLDMTQIRDQIQQNQDKIDVFQQNGGNAIEEDKLRKKNEQLNKQLDQKETEKIAHNQDLDEIAQYQMAKEMKKINVKRTDRLGLQIGIELTKIAGDIATLTGVGAQVGTPLKLVAAGVGAAMPAVRSLKQMGRDRAASPDAWKLTKAVFNAEKSTVKKGEKRANDATLLIEMIQKLPVLDRSNPDIVTRYEQVGSFIEAAGVDLLELEKIETLRSDPDKLKTSLIEAMGKRE